MSIYDNEQEIEALKSIFEDLLDDNRGEKYCFLEDSRKLAQIEKYLYFIYEKRGDLKELVYIGVSHSKNNRIAQYRSVKDKGTKNFRKKAGLNFETLGEHQAYIKNNFKFSYINLSNWEEKPKIIEALAIGVYNPKYNY